MCGHMKFELEKMSAVFTTDGVYTSHILFSSEFLINK